MSFEAITHVKPIEVFATQTPADQAFLASMPNTELRRFVDHALASMIYELRTRMIGDGIQTLSVTAKAEAYAHAAVSVAIPVRTPGNLFKLWAREDMAGAHLRWLRRFGARIRVKVEQYFDEDEDTRTITQTETRQYSERFCPHIAIPDHSRHLEWVEYGDVDGD